MATEKTDVVIVGMGAAGAVLAAELAKAGMKVTGLERGPRLSTADFKPRDELRFFQRQDLRPNPKRQPATWRPNAGARPRPLWRGLVALSRGRFPRPLGDHRALRGGRDPGGILAHRLALELRG